MKGVLEISYTTMWMYITLVNYIHLKLLRWSISCVFYHTHTITELTSSVVEREWTFLTHLNILLSLSQVDKPRKGLWLAWLWILPCVDHQRRTGWRHHDFPGCRREGVIRHPSKTQLILVRGMECAMASFRPSHIAGVGRATSSRKRWGKRIRGDNTITE